MTIQMKSGLGGDKITMRRIKIRRLLIMDLIQWEIAAMRNIKMMIRSTIKEQRTMKSIQIWIFKNKMD